MSGTVRAADAVTDLAVVQAARKGLPPATFQKELPRVGDLAIAIGSLSSVEDFLAALRPLHPGDTVTVSYVRGQDKREAKVVLADRPTANG